MGNFCQSRRPAIAAAAAAAAFAWLTPLSTADAQPAAPKIVSPTSEATVNDVVRFVANSERTAVRAVLYIDGESRRVSKGRRVRWNFGNVDLHELAPGRHRVAVTVTYRSGRRATARSAIVVRGGRDGAASGAVAPTPTPASTPPASTPPASTPPASTPPASTPPTPTQPPTTPKPTPPPSSPPPSTPPPSTPPASTPPAAKAPLWSDGMESGDWRNWSWWNQGQPWLMSQVQLTNVLASAEGITAHGGSRVARFEVRPEDAAAGRIHAKLFKTFSNGESSYATRRSPADVSGTYRVKYFFPTTYRVPANTQVNAFQFKEKYLVGTRTAWTSDPQDPLWWIQLGDSDWAKKMGGPQGSRPDAPVAFINNWTNPWKRKIGWRVLPLGRWVEFRADIVQGERIDFYIDGQLLDTGYQSEYPVSPFHATSVDWTFGIGNYSGAANGPMYADDASFTPR